MDVFISILLFWLPLIGPLIAGILGGKKAGGVGKGLIAVFLPGIVIAGSFYAAASMLTGFPIIGAIVAMGGLALALLGIGPLLVGAIIGGVLAYSDCYSAICAIAKKFFPATKVFNVEDGNSQLVCLLGR